jgi:hypothetical protein
MSNRDLDDKEMNRVFLAFEEYANGTNGGLSAFIRVLWAEAYDLGAKDKAKYYYAQGYDAGRKSERSKQDS